MFTCFPDVMQCSASRQPSKTLVHISGHQRIQKSSSLLEMPEAFQPRPHSNCILFLSVLTGQLHLLIHCLPFFNQPMTYILPENFCLGLRWITCDCSNIEKKHRLLYDRLCQLLQFAFTVLYGFVPVETRVLSRGELLD